MNKNTALHTLSYLENDCGIIVAQFRLKVWAQYYTIITKFIVVMNIISFYTVRFLL